MSHAILGVDFKCLGRILTFFNNISHNVIKFYTIVDDIHLTLSGDTLCSYKEEIKVLCQPLIKFGHSALATYIKVIYSLTGPYKETR